MRRPAQHAASLAELEAWHSADMHVSGLAKWHPGPRLCYNVPVVIGRTQDGPVFSPLWPSLFDLRPPQNTPVLRVGERPLSNAPISGIP